MLLCRACGVEKSSTRFSFNQIYKTCACNSCVTDKIADLKAKKHHRDRFMTEYRAIRNEYKRT